MQLSSNFLKLYSASTLYVKVLNINGFLSLHETSIKHVAPSPSHAIDFARPCITWNGKTSSIPLQKIIDAYSAYERK